MTPQSDTAIARQQRVKKAERARRYLQGGTLRRDDSDDELGLEDHPWEWIYEDRQAIEDGEPTEMDVDALNTNVGEVSGNGSFKEREARRRSSGASRQKIIGAKMGQFECKVGDTVLLKAEGNNEAWVGIICEFMEEEDEKVANFMWFSTEKEIRNKEKKRKDFVPVKLPLKYVVFGSNARPRTKYTFHHHGTSTPWHRLMEKPQ